MITELKSLEDFQVKLETKGIKVSKINSTTSDIERMMRLFIKMDSEFLFPTDDKEELEKYTEKLIDNAFNFILIDNNQDIGIVSIYANDYITKTAYTSTIGILPSYRGGSIVVHLVEFAIGFAKEMGMERYKSEVHKKNGKWLSFLKSYKFLIESETDNDSYIIVRDLMLD